MHVCSACRLPELDAAGGEEPRALQLQVTSIYLSSLKVCHSQRADLQSLGQLATTVSTPPPKHLAKSHVVTAGWLVTAETQDKAIEQAAELAGSHASWHTPEHGATQVAGQRTPCQVHATLASRIRHAPTCGDLHD